MPNDKTLPEILSVEFPSVSEHHRPSRHVETNRESLSCEKNLDQALLNRGNMWHEQTTAGEGQARKWSQVTQFE